MENINTKYPRTYHLPWSPGTTSDDRKLSGDWFENYKGKEIVITEKLDGLLEKAKADASLKEKLLDTRNSSNPVAAFCEIASDNGFPMTVMDIINQGEEFYAEIKRSTNGGGENSPDLDFQNDEYSIFMMRLEG